MNPMKFQHCLIQAQEVLSGKKNSTIIYKKGKIKRRKKIKKSQKFLDFIFYDFFRFFKKSWKKKKNWKKKIDNIPKKQFHDFHRIEFYKKKSGKKSEK